MIILIVIIGLSLLILGHEAGHFLAARIMGMKVEEFGFGFPPRIWGWKPKRGETKYSLNWLPFGGFVRIAGENDRIQGNTEKLAALPESERRKMFYYQKPWRRSVVILAGVTVNFLLGWLIISSIFMVGTSSTLAIYEVQPGSPAEAVGLLPGDIVANFRTAEQFIAYVNDHRGEEIEMNIRRNGESLTFRVVPRMETAPNEGAVGIVFAGIASRGPLTALREGFLATIEMTQLTFLGFYELLRSLVLTGRVPGEIVGPVGIVSIATETGRAGLIYVLQLIAFISINLAVINLLPFPALDGGRFLMILFEKFKGSPIPRQIEMWVNGVGFVLLVLLMVFITVRDIVRL